MRKTVLSLFMLGLGIAYAAANPPFTYQWHSLLVTNTEAKPQCTIYGMKTDANGNVYTLATYGSTIGTTATFLNLSLTGEEYNSGNSYNRNVLLVKHDFAGNVIWALHSEAGDCDMANCAYTPTADGGAFLALKMRIGDTGKLLTMVGSDNQTKTVEFTYQDKRVYQPVFMKISSTGTISFVSEASIDYSPAPAASGSYTWGVSDGFAFYDAAEDADGNLFVAARIARDLTVGQTTILHHNTEGWNGDSQTTRGNGLILKLDKDGNYKSHLCSGGSATHDSFRDMLYKEGKLYLSGLVYGKDANGTLSLGDKSQTYEQGGHMITACVSAADLSAEYLTVIKGVNLSSGLQQELMAFRNNGNILVGGGINAKLQINTETTVGSNSGYKSYLLEINPANGQCLQGYASTTGISKVYGVMERNDSIYLLEYDWGRGNNDKVFLTSLDKDMTVGTSYPIVNTKAAATAWAMANYNGQFVIAARSMKGHDVSLTGLNETFTSGTQWYGIAAGYKFNGSTPGTGLSGNEASNGRVFAAGGQVIVSHAAGQDVAIYNVLGHCIRQFTAASDHESQPLQSGIYIVRIGKQSTKIIL